ncbi:hypothetical protein [Acrocarpospora phusangensis]|uniref:hypothetical protein n=1 Tax=Acrocarpospora phusangensis TaxID=1070424 RepID=UPI0019511A0E|nr:hypothetical protein [Acrocarpospora phusangensis]
MLGVPILYVVGALAVILAVVAWRMKPATGVQLADEPAAEDEPAAGDPAGGVPLPYVSGGSVSQAPLPDPNDGPSADDNDKWLRRSAEWLAGQGHATMDAALIALQKYLAGEQLSMEQGRLRDLATDHFGYPPDLPQSGGTGNGDAPDDPDVPTPPVPPTPPVVVPAEPKKYIAPAFHTVSGPSDDSYTDMALLFYGESGVQYGVDLIQSYNVKHGHQGPFPPGTRFWIPKYAPPRYVIATASMRTASQIISKNPPLNSVAMLQELNDGMTFPVKVGQKVRVA